MESKSKEETKILDSGNPSMLALWPGSWLHAEVSSLPDLFPGNGEQRRNPRDNKIKLVR